MKFDFASQDLNVRHDLTICDGAETPRPKVIELPSFRLNFDEDRAEFTFRVAKQRINDLEIQSKIIHFEYASFRSRSVKNKSLVLQVENESTQESNFIVFKCTGNFKNVLLNLFSPHSKSFKLTLDFMFDHKKFKSSFVTYIPEIEQK